MADLSASESRESHYTVGHVPTLTRTRASEGTEGCQSPHAQLAILKLTCEPSFFSLKADSGAWARGACSALLKLKACKVSLGAVSTMKAAAAVSGSTECSLEMPSQ
eukprot:511403-Amphidinium_carterae.2